MKYGIVFAHLRNDFSGSPKVLLSVVAAIATSGRRAKLFIGSDGNGCLSHCRLPITRYWYRRGGHRMATMFSYLFSQCALFFKLLCDRSIDRNAVIYVNTLLPFGAATYGWMTGRRVIYHVHEISLTPAPLKRLLVGVAGVTSRLNVYVSDAHIRGMPIAGVPARRIYNALDEYMGAKAAASVYRHRREGVFSVLMVAYLRDYKGVPEFVALAARLVGRADLRFDLVVNDDGKAIDQYFRGKLPPPNLKLHSRVEETSSFFARASLVLNLSRVDQCVETFGMTVLEALAFGVPVIVPPVGGPAELVSDGVQGYLVDSRDLARLEEVVLRLSGDAELCQRMSVACRARAADFSPEAFARGIRAAVDSV